MKSTHLMSQVATFSSVTMFQICFCGEESMYVVLLGDIMRRERMGNKDGTVQCYIKTVSVEKLQKMTDVQFQHSIKGSIT